MFCYGHNLAIKQVEGQINAQSFLSLFLHIYQTFNGHNVAIKQVEGQTDGQSFLSPLHKRVKRPFNILCNTLESKMDTI